LRLLDVTGGLNKFRTGPVLHEAYVARSFKDTRRVLGCRQGIKCV